MVNITERVKKTINNIHRLAYDTRSYGWYPPYSQGSLLIESLDTREGFKLKSVDDIAYYLAIWRFADDFVNEECVLEAVINCADEIGCVYGDVYELEKDIRRFYI